MVVAHMDIELKKVHKGTVLGHIIREKSVLEN
jgi:hypothetical protein